MFVRLAKLQWVNIALAQSVSVIKDKLGDGYSLSLRYADHVAIDEEDCYGFESVELAKQAAKQIEASTGRHVSWSDEWP